MGTIVETWEQEGWKNGRTEGLTEGRAHRLTHLLEQRFGTLPDAARARIRSADLGDLETRFDAAIEAGSLTEVVGNRETGNT